MSGAGNTVRMNSGWGGARRPGSSLDEWLVRIRTLNGASHVKSRFGMKLRRRWRQDKRPKAVVDPDACMVTSRALRGLFPGGRRTRAASRTRCCWKAPRAPTLNSSRGRWDEGGCNERANV
jgi:hypothetical protein